MGREIHARFEVKNLKERDYFEDLGVDWRMLLKRILKKQVGRIDLIHLVQEKDTRWSL
jgi:hypothetical protein